MIGSSCKGYRVRSATKRVQCARIQAGILGQI